MNNSTPVSDQDLLTRISHGDVKAFENLFYRYYETLCQYACKYLNQEQVAEEIVSGLFTHLWEKRKEVQITSSCKAYLYASTKNASFNYLKSQYARNPFQQESEAQPHPLTLSPAEELSYKELQAIIQNGIDKLPERCRIIFNLSRNAGLSYEEIAVELGISKKTVKAQMGIALHKLRVYLDRHWDKILVVLVHML